MPQNQNINPRTWVMLLNSLRQMWADWGRHFLSLVLHSTHFISSSFPFFFSYFPSTFLFSCPFYHPSLSFPDFSDFSFLSTHFFSSHFLHSSLFFFISLLLFQAFFFFLFPPPKYYYFYFFFSNIQTLSHSCLFFFLSSPPHPHDNVPSKWL